MFRVLLTVSVFVLLLFAQVVMAQDEGMMMGESVMDESKMDAMMSGEFTAVISSGRARIRAEASLDGEVRGFCRLGDRLTVWLPAIDDWLTSSCQGVTGFIHSSLVDVGEAVVPTDAAMMDDGMMMDDSMKDDGMMMDDSMMEDSMMDKMMAGEFSAVITRGRARIRAGASLDAEILGFCQKSDQLTVWLPGDGDWLTSSCHGVTGFIHSSLVDVGGPAIPTISDLGESDGMAMKDDMSMDEM